MKIIHATTFLQGGAGRVITDLAIAQHASGHDVSVVTSLTGVLGYGNYDAYLQRLARTGVPVHAVDSLFTREYAANLCALDAFDAIAADAVPDIIHAHAAVPGLMALVFAGSCREPVAVIQTMHGWGVAKTTAQADADIRTLSRAHRVVVASRHSADLVSGLGLPADLLRVIPYGVGTDASELSAADCARLDEMRAAQARGRLVLAAVGTIGARKNQRLLIEAIGVLPNPRDVHAVIVGDGDLEPLRQEIAARRLEHSVHLHGYSAAARRLAAGADVLVLPSQSEGQPLAVLEAFCDGTLVVASDIPELRELVTDRATGLTFAAGDAWDLARAIARARHLSFEDRDAVTANARERFQTTFSLPAMTRAYQREYATLVPVDRRAPAALEPIAL